MERYIAVDWGSTRLRAWHIAGGEVINRLSLPSGVANLAPGEAPEIFRRHIEPWRRSSPLPVIMAGMIGSDAGWRPVPYLACPLPLADIGRGLCDVAEQVRIVPGLKLDRAGEYGVMRGEETQLLGAMRLAPASCCVLPGTHSKWVQLDGERVERFATAMTGELHHLLMQHSLIGKGLPAQQRDDDAFSDGLDKGLAAPSLVDALFPVRAARVLGALPRSSVADALSGLLIGAEAATFARRYRPQRITLVASDALAPRYQQAFDRLGIAVSPCPGEAAFLHGIRSIIDGRY